MPDEAQLRLLAFTLAVPHRGLLKVHRAQRVDEVFCIVGFVGAKCDRCRSIGTRLDHVQRGHPFGMTVRQRQAGVDHHAVAVLHQPMPDEAQLRLLAFTLAVSHRGLLKAFLAETLAPESGARTGGGGMMTYDQAAVGLCDSARGKEHRELLMATELPWMAGTARFRAAGSLRAFSSRASRSRFGKLALLCHLRRCPRRGHRHEKPIKMVLAAGRWLGQFRLGSGGRDYADAAGTMQR